MKRIIPKIGELYVRMYYHENDSCEVRKVGVITDKFVYLYNKYSPAAYRIKIFNMLCKENHMIKVDKPLKYLFYDLFYK